MLRSLVQEKRRSSWCLREGAQASGDGMSPSQSVQWSRGSVSGWHWRKKLEPWGLKATNQIPKQKNNELTTEQGQGINDSIYRYIDIQERVSNIEPDCTRPWYDTHHTNCTPWTPQMKQLLIDGNHQNPPRLVNTKSEPQKCSVPSNYRPITCLCTT